MVRAAQGYSSKGPRAITRRRGRTGGCRSRLHDWHYAPGNMVQGSNPFQVTIAAFG